MKNDSEKKGKKPPWESNPFEKVTDHMNSLFKGGWSIGIMVLIVILFILALSSYYTIGVDQVGVIQRFGRYARTTMPGLHFKFPAGIENLTKVKVKYVNTEEFGLRTIQAGVRTRYAPGSRYFDESLMLTGDLNCALVPWIVQYRIGDPYDFLFKVRDVRSTLRDLSEAVMSQVVGDRSVNEVINKRKEIADLAKVELQKALNDAVTGITLVNIELKKTNVPEPVQPSFNEVNQAVQEKEKMIYQAKEAYNKAIPAAKGDAEKVIKSAEGYAMDRINRSEGDASRFLVLWEEYTKSKNVTRRRLYLESMREVIPKLGKKYIIDPEQKGILPLLNLDIKGER
ncbi:MAG: FtsH protease activity modulator HflK [Thermodesulfobacteriota bacterium]|nr:FtsH protease activity modulator HflK [Thermodesulfobacteriota bacterium]